MKVKRYSVFSGTGPKNMETFSYGVYLAPPKQTGEKVNKMRGIQGRRRYSSRNRT